MTKVRLQNLMFLVILTLGSGLTAKADGTEILEVGGSNFPTYSITSYPADAKLWTQPLALRPLIGTMHFEPERVKAELAVMRKNGQRKIALVIWYAPLKKVSSKVYHDVYAHVVASDGGKLSPQHTENLITILNWIADLKFDEVQVRFAAQSTASSNAWKDWDEAKYQENWNFIASTVKATNTITKSRNLTVVYDLGVELAGITEGQTENYVRRLWTDYNHIFGNNNSYGFSIIPSPNRLAIYIFNLSKTGIMPKSYAVDVYDRVALSVFQQLEWIAADLKKTGELQKSVLIQEANYNDLNSYSQFLRSKSELGLNIRAIMQWPLFANNTTHFDLDFPEDYTNYLGAVASSKPTIKVSPAICTINSNKTCSTNVVWNTRLPEEPYVTVSSAKATVPKLFAKGLNGSQEAPWITPGSFDFNLWPSSEFSGNSTAIASTSVFGVQLSGKIVSEKQSGSCVLDKKSKVCSLRMYWSAPGLGNETLTVYVYQGKKPAGGYGKLFSNSGMTGTSLANWIQEDTYTFTLMAGPKVLDTLTVRGVKP